MFSTCANVWRAPLVALVLLAGAAPAAEAGWWSTARPTARFDLQQEAPRGDPLNGVLMIAGAVALFVFMAWVAVRIGQNDHPADKIPN